MKQEKIIIIAGPTATGKTKIAVEVALVVNGEVIGADSMQIYRGLEIGTAAPTKDEMRGVPHHLIGVVEPLENFTAWDWLVSAEKLIAEIAARDKVPIVAGGTGLYIRSLLKGLFDTPFPDPDLRNRLKKCDDVEGFYARLKEVDPVSANKIHPNDKYRIVRALEVFEQTGKPVSQLRSEWEAPDRYKALKILLDIPRDELYKRINERAEEMVKMGLIEEVKRIKERGCSRESKPMQHFGYRYIWSFLEGEIPLERALELMKRDTRHYARKQLTWFKKERNFIRFNPITQTREIIRTASKFFNS